MTHLIKVRYVALLGYFPCGHAIHCSLLNFFPPLMTVVDTLNIKLYIIPCNCAF